MSDAIVFLTNGPSVKEGRVKSELTLKWMDGNVEKYSNEQRWGTGTKDGAEMISKLFKHLLEQLSEQGIAPTPGIYLVFKGVTNEQFFAIQEAGVSLQQSLLEFGKKLAKEKKKND